MTDLSRRSFFFGALAAPVVAKIATMEALVSVPAPVAPALVYGDIAETTAIWAAREMLKHAQPLMMLSRMSLTHPMPRNSVETITFRRPQLFDAAAASQ